MVISSVEADPGGRPVLGFVGDRVAVLVFPNCVRTKTLSFRLANASPACLPRRSPIVRGTSTESSPADRPTQGFGCLMTGRVGGGPRWLRWSGRCAKTLPARPRLGRFGNAGSGVPRPGGTKPNQRTPTDVDAAGR